MTEQTNFIDVNALRKQFPALQREVNGRQLSFLDGPGGTQVSQSVIDAMSDYLARGSSNLGGPFLTSREAEEVTDNARLAMQDFLNARRPEEIAFGQNMTSLTFAVSRAISRGWQPGDEIILTRLDHDANISPWLLAAEERGVTVRWLDFEPSDCVLKLHTLPDLLNEKTRLVAVSYASNAVGSLTDVKEVARLAHEQGALVYVDSVHYAPHNLIDVQDLDCDFLVCSSYKFFGPHQGVLFGKYDLLADLMAYKVRPAPAEPPGKWETGTQSFESLAGSTAAVDYIAAIGGGAGSRRERIVRAMWAIKAYERSLSERFLRGAVQIPGLQVFGITDIENLENRAPTFAVRLDGYTAEEVATRLGDQGIFVWHGHYYAVAVMERLGLLDQGGLVRIGFVHYNTHDEVEGVLAALERLAAS
ncbi:MAG: cysteine desulfurase-like protein [Candidatus Promineifilaceae bacterium]|jgi:cysteine desulfurase family protein (TIGR01976 family)